MTGSYRSLRVVRMDGSEHVILYDAADAEVVESRTWHVTSNPRAPGNFYAVSNIQKSDGKRTKITMHALLMGRPWIDHINHDGLDNRRGNLRHVTPSQNAANMRPRRVATSRFKGVSWDKRDRTWVAQIKVAGRRRRIGSFRDEVAAARAYDQAALEAFGRFAHLNFPLLTEALS